MAKTLNRRASRINAIKILYIIQQTNVSINQAYDMVISMDDDLNEGVIDEAAIEFVTKTIDEMYEIDKIIESSLVNYQLSRLNFTDLSIVRLCTMELLNGTEANICINEAIEISKIYSDLEDSKASKFNNRLLQTIKDKVLGE